MPAPRGYDPARIRGRLQAVNLSSFFRIIGKQHADTPLGAAPSPSRFSDPAGAYAVLYAAEAVRCGFWEVVARDRFTRRSRRMLPLADIEARLVVTLRSTRPLWLVDLRGDGPIRIGAPTAVAHDTNHAAGRALSATVHASVPEADGFLYHSRFTGEACVAVFDRAFDRLEAVEVAPLAEQADVLDVLDEYDITLTTAPG